MIVYIGGLIFIFYYLYLIYIIYLLLYIYLYIILLFIYIYYYIIYIVICPKNGTIFTLRVPGMGLLFFGSGFYIGYMFMCTMVLKVPS